MSSPARACDRVTLRDSITLAHASLNRFNLSLSLSLSVSVSRFSVERDSLLFRSGPGRAAETRNDEKAQSSALVSLSRFLLSLFLQRIG